MPASLDHLPPLPDDLFVIDPVVHALNLDHGNVASKYGEQLYQMSYGLHAMLSPPHALAPQATYMTDMAPEVLVRTMLEESRTSLIATHTLRLDSWFRDGFAAEWKTIAMTRDFPTRVLGYVGLDPCEEKAAVLDDLERQVAATPNAVGVKLYPHQMNPYRRWLTSDDTVVALIERAQALGLKTIAIHKALPNGSVPLAPYRIGEDFEEAADAFPEMSFEIVHSGMAFIEETAMAIGRFPNVYANLETTTAMLWQAPGRFESALALLMQWGGPEKIIWSTGCTVVHPQHLIELMWAFQFSEEAQARHGIPPISEDVKRLIFAGNYARAVGLEIEVWRARQAEDDFAWPVELKRPWSAWVGR
ncbi:amidohydrolase family protein [Sphingomonas sp. GlSt437]|uniref:amidohydrolase family protein n=1 Tax=Sphingomonas sp. GlSt437 TaxID=3389970 RepID=UPI003A8ABCA8